MRLDGGSGYAAIAKANGMTRQVSTAKKVLSPAKKVIAKILGAGSGVGAIVYMAGNFATAIDSRRDLAGAVEAAQKDVDAFCQE
jgi:hypothetical protein